MSKPQVIIDAVVLAAAVAAFIINLRFLRRGKRRVGRVVAQWRIRFNLSLPWEWLRLALLLALIVLVLTLWRTKPLSGDWLGTLAVALLVAAFFPRDNHVIVGTRGVLDRWRFVPWSSVEGRRLVEDRGRRILELRVRPDRTSRNPGGTRRIRVPWNVALDLDSD
jgi:MFS superfamily sulfate permease-like transporter